jgi:hypothetical protein
MSDNESLHNSDFTCHDDNKQLCNCCYCDLGPGAEIPSTAESLESISDIRSETGVESLHSSDFSCYGDNKPFCSCCYSDDELEDTNGPKSPSPIQMDYLNARNRHIFVQTPESVAQSVELIGTSIDYVNDDFITYDLCIAAITWYGGEIHSILTRRHLFTTREYYDICLHTVRLNGWDLKYIPDDVQTQELCDTAVRTSCWALEFVRDEFKTYDNCYSAVRRNGQTMKFVPDVLIDEAMCLAGAKARYPCLNFIPRRFLTRELCYIAVRGDGGDIKNVPEEFMSSELAYLAITSPATSNPTSNMAGSNIQYVPARYLTREIILEALKRWSGIYGRIPAECITPEMELEILDVSPWCLRSMEQTPEKCMRAIRADSRVLRQVMKREDITREMAEYALGLSRDERVDFGKELYRHLKTLVRDERS